MIATFSIDESITVKIGDLEQQSGVTANDFTSCVKYQITVSDTLIKEYSVVINKGVLEAYLKAPNNYNNIMFGYSVAISEDTIAIGAAEEDSDTATIINGSDLSSTNDNATNSGAVYVYVRTESQWTHQAYLKAPNNSFRNYFGEKVAVSGDTIVVCAPNERNTTTSIINDSDLSSTNEEGNDNGAVYAFE